MATAQITHKQALEILAFCEKHDNDDFFFSNDHGAYFGACTGSHEQSTFENCIQYLEGMNPNNEEDDWFESTVNVFGGDDFGVHLPVEWLRHFKSCKGEGDMFTVTITDSEVRLTI